MALSHGHTISIGHSWTPKNPILTQLLSSEREMMLYFLLQHLVLMIILHTLIAPFENAFIFDHTIMMGIDCFVQQIIFIQKGLKTLLGSTIKPLTIIQFMCSHVIFEWPILFFVPDMFIGIVFYDRGITPIQLPRNYDLPTITIITRNTLIDLPTNILRTITSREACL